MDQKDPTLAADLLQNRAKDVMQRVKRLWLCVFVGLGSVTLGGGYLAYYFFGWLGPVVALVILIVVICACLRYLQYL